MNEKPITWAYLAGFTDGDGYIRVRRRSNKNNRPGYLDVELAWSQKYENSWVLEEIKTFFEAQGFHVNDRLFKNNTSMHEQRCIRLNRRAEVKLVLTKLLPWLIAKAPTAKEALNLIHEIEQHPASRKLVRE